MSITLHNGDALEVLRCMSDAVIDAVVIDPPAGINFMQKEFDSDRGGRAAWVAWLASILSECLRVARPGARMLCWAIPRTSHWTGTAIEDAGWTIEDRISHLFGQGFPKAKSKLKPACEDWWLARKPSRGVPELPGLDKCRIAADWANDPSRRGLGYGYTREGYTKNGTVSEGLGPRTEYDTSKGRWPANLVLSHHPACKGECHPDCPVAMLDEQSGEQKGDPPNRKPRLKRAEKFGWSGDAGQDYETAGYTDSGGASRFFYCSKASRADRGPDNTHPTCKNTALMAWLARLICPPGGTVLDCFMGSGSTGVACIREGFGFIGIEREAEYFRIAEGRIAAAASDAPLFAGTA